MIKGKSIDYWLLIFLPTLSMVVLGLFWELFGWLLVVVIEGNDEWVMQGYISLILVGISLFWSFKNFMQAYKINKAQQSNNERKN